MKKNLIQQKRKVNETKMLFVYLGSTFPQVLKYEITSLHYKYPWVDVIVVQNISVFSFIPFNMKFSFSCHNDFFL